MGKESRLRSLDFKNTNHINGDQKSNQKRFLVAWTRLVKILDKVVHWTTPYPVDS